ncbi:copper homeostasis protein CutC [Nocardia sp. CDC159]|uniref:PF03932 family protein CutC n=1 Tax=Nocardia pulmonis TaxID=2951408 RepID=A0A9X2EA49_9NOCA|nr:MULTISPECIES: copper homeostasis protein CutC [Nocardia]MCM6774586.1 copper homeostasis protein CutC [Nocardia pulmonis]MCM6787349.1 copper homeostasis protein CutC [Nocardia sp. CDC159]
MRDVRVEISVESIAGVEVAARCGADRVELCGALAEGGLTPSQGLIEVALRLAGNVEVHPLIRPRPGDFRYEPDEVSVMVSDVRAAVRAGTHGVVVGALGADGLLDTAACAALIEAAAGRSVTLHRAIDASASPHRVLDQAIALGFTRVLTSGAQRSAVDGAATIARLVAQADGRIAIMACGGIRAAGAREIVAATGVRDIHAAVRTPVRGADPGTVSFAGVGVPDGFDRFATDADGVRALCAALDRGTGR